MINKLKHMLKGDKYYNEFTIQQNKYLYMRHLMNNTIRYLSDKLKHDSINDHSLPDITARFFAFCNNDISHDEFLKDYKKCIESIFKQLEEKNKVINLRDNTIKALEKEIVLMNNKNNKYSEIDIDEFLTNTYKSKYLESTIYSKRSKKQLLNIFNKLLNEEKIYVKGLYDALYYSKKLKTKSKSLYKQLHCYYLTEKGKAEIQIGD